MTPLAHLIAKQITLPVRKRVAGDHADLMHKMDDVHCFDVSGASAATSSLSLRIQDGESIGHLAFLPASKTWIETGHRGDGARMGWLLNSERQRLGCGRFHGPQLFGSGGR